MILPISQQNHPRRVLKVVRNLPQRPRLRKSTRLEIVALIIALVYLRRDHIFAIIAHFDVRQTLEQLNDFLVSIETCEVLFGDVGPPPCWRIKDVS